MAVVRKPASTNKVVAKTAKVTAKKVTTKAAPVKAKAVVDSKKTVAKKASTTVKADTKKSVAKKTATSKAKGGKISLTPSKTSKTFEIRVGGQATQEAFIDRFYKKLVDIGYEITKEQTKTIQKAYSETLSEVTEIASFQDTTSGIFYGRRIIKTRVTNPPKAADGLQTLMLVHPEVKVRKQLADETKIKFFGQLSEDDSNIFITSDGEEINIAETEEVLLAEYTDAKAPAKKSSKGSKSEEVDEDEEEDLIEDDIDAEEELEELEEELEDEEDDLFEDDDEE